MNSNTDNNELTPPLELIPAILQACDKVMEDAQKHIDEAYVIINKWTDKLQQSREYKQKLEAVLSSISQGAEVIRTAQGSNKLGYPMNLGWEEKAKFILIIENPKLSTSEIANLIILKYEPKWKFNRSKLVKHLSYVLNKEDGLFDKEEVPGGEALYSLKEDNANEININNKPQVEEQAAI